MTLDPGQEGVCPAGDHTRPVARHGQLWCATCGHRFPCVENRNAATTVGIALDIMGE